MDPRVEEFLKAHLGEVQEFRETLSPETDRGCALMAAAFLDSQLEQLLRAAWVEDESALDEVLGQSRALGTFSSRIDMAYLVGLIGDQARRDFHLIRKIRNDFGHRPTPITFDTESIANRCNQLYYTFRPKEHGPRSLFTSTVLGLLAIIHTAQHHVKRATQATDAPINDAIRRDRMENIEEDVASLMALLEKPPTPER